MKETSEGPDKTVFPSEQALITWVCSVYEYLNSCLITTFEFSVYIIFQEKLGNQDIIHEWMLIHSKRSKY